MISIHPPLYATTIALHAMLLTQNPVEAPPTNSVHRITRWAINSGADTGLDGVLCEVQGSPVGLRVVPNVAEAVLSPDTHTNSRFRMRIGLLTPRTGPFIEPDCTDDAVFDQCEPDCQPNGTADPCDIDSCPACTPACVDCNDNGVPDGCDVARGYSQDLNLVDGQPIGNGIPDECETCPADLNCDGVVNPFDLALLLGSWGLCPCEVLICPQQPDADVNGDCIVNPFDLALLLGAWGGCLCDVDADCPSGDCDGTGHCTPP